MSTVLKLGLAAVTLIASGAAARADVCDRLWYDRNAIYADAGYCFQTPRARATFGPGCRPPYGRLTPGAQRRINEIQAEEYARGCPR
jgi:hypothetical protein